MPYVSGRSYVKWHLPSASTADGEHTGRSGKVSIKDHKALYNYDVHVSVRMVIDKSSMLQETPLQFLVIHEVHHSEKIQLGTVKLNLAEYVDASEQGVEDEGVVRRYLMQDSKINSTLKIGVFLKQTEGDRSFNTPPLRVAPVFSGIAGLVVGEVDDNEGIGANVPVAASKHSQVAHDELRELYRRTIAANWTALPGELSADKVIEDIFSGGDGWLTQPNDSGKGSGQDDDGHGNHAKKRSADRKHWFFTARSKQDVARHSRDNIHDKGDGVQRSMAGAIRGRNSFESQASKMGGEAEKGQRRVTNDFDEMDIREDLKSWRLPT